MTTIEKWTRYLAGAAITAATSLMLSATACGQTPSAGDASILPEQRGQPHSPPTVAMRAADMGLSLGRRYENRGLFVDEMTRHGALAHAGLRVGDQIVAINGQPLTRESQFVQAMLDAGRGNQAANLRIVRTGQQQTLIVHPAAVRQSVFNADPLFQAGALVDEHSPRKLVVQRVIPGSPAFAVGIVAGDVITQVGNSPLANLDTLRQAIEQANGDGIVLEIDHGGRSHLVTLPDIDAGLMRTAMRAGVSPTAPATGASSTQRR